MKVVKEPKFSGAKPLAGCVCSSGQAKTRGAFDPIWSCKCQCNGGAYNFNCNHNKADDGSGCP